MVDIDIHLHEGELKTLVQTLASLKESGLKRAMGRANRKLSRWFSTQAGRAISQQYGLKVGQFQKIRITVSKADFNAQGKPAMVWIGANPVAAHLIGTPKAAPAYQGAFAKKYFFKDGFVAQVGGGGRKIFKRRGATRLPIDLQGVDIKHGAEESVKRLIKRGREHYKKILSQEINFEISKLK